MKAVNAVRGLVRPIVTLGLTAALIYGFASDKLGSQEFLTVATVVITWWFADRTHNSAGGGAI